MRCWVKPISILQFIALGAMGFSPFGENPGGSKPPPYITALTR